MSMEWRDLMNGDKYTAAGMRKESFACILKKTVYIAVKLYFFFE